MSNRRCAAKTCFNLRGCRPNLKFFPFPKDEATCRQWVANCGRTDLQDKTADQLSKLLLCADHFETHWFLNPKYKTVFVRTGQPIPTIFHNNLVDFIPKSLRKSIELKNQQSGTTEATVTLQVAVDEDSAQPDGPRSGCHKMCRLCACLVHEDKLSSIFSEESEQHCLLAKINRLLPDKVEEEDGLPHHVCSSCITKLNECSQTVQAFVEADKKLRDLFENSHSACQEASLIKLEEDYCDVKPNILPSTAEHHEFVNTKDTNSLSSGVSFSGFVPDRTIEVYNIKEGRDSDLEDLNIDEEQIAADSLDSNTAEYVCTGQDCWTEVIEPDGAKKIEEKSNVYSCVVCNKTFAGKNKLLIHEISEHACEKKNGSGTAGPRKYKRRQTHVCEDCGNSFIGLKPLKRHIREYHIPAENICEFCGAHYKIKSQLEVHRRLHTNEKPFSCGICNESFHFKKALRRHKRVHIEPKSLTCSICNKTFGNRSALWRHERIHTNNRSVLCYLCGKVLSNAQSLRVHMRTHSSDRPCSCPTCGKTFKDNRSVTKHMVMHSAAKNFRCDVCGRAFYSKALVKQHKLSHSGVKPHKCETCGAAFNRLGNLNQHKKKHLTEGDAEQNRPKLTYECVVCGKWMKSELTLKYHLAKHTGEKKPFDCEQCGKRFVAVDPYRVHMRIHTGERPYECNMCDKTFRSSFTLKQHTALHKDEFPYPCPYCERRFKRLQSLVVHKRTHTGEKPHQCPVCGRGFAQKGDMLKHMKTHSRERNKPVVMELEHITELVLSDTEITSEFLIDMPIVEVETEMQPVKQDIHLEIQPDIHTDITSQIEPVIHSQIQPDIHCVIQTEM